MEAKHRTRLAVSSWYHRYLEVRVDISGNRNWYDQDYQEPTIIERGPKTWVTTAYLVQIVNKSHQIVTLKVQHASFILFVIQHIAESIVEIGRRPLETMEFL